MKPGDYVKATCNDERHWRAVVVGTVLSIGVEERENTGTSTILHVICPSGFEYTVNLSSDRITVEQLTERKYFHELIKYPNGIS